MNKEPFVSIIIVNWNGQEILEDCLKTLKQVTYKNYELIVVDNNSTDASLDILSEYQDIILIKNKSNVGFAPANNQGYKKSKGEYILLLNNDTKVPKEFLSVMVEKMESDPSIGALQPKIFLMDKPKYLDNCGSFMTPTGLLKHWGFMSKDSEEFNQEAEVFSAKGACLLTRRNIIEQIGLFDDSFGSYFEESDFCYRVWMMGKRVIYFPEAHIYHKLGYTSKRMSAIDINFNSTKNRLASYIKNMQMQSLFKIFLYHLAIIVGLGFYYLFKLQFSKSVMMFRSIGWNILHLSDLLQKRIVVQKKRIVSDSEIFAKTMQTVTLRELFSHFQKVEANFK
jgi:GT2 family glycosyltransferase